MLIDIEILYKIHQKLQRLIDRSRRRKVISCFGIRSKGICLGLHPGKKFRHILPFIAKHLMFEKMGTACAVMQDAVADLFINIKASGPETAQEKRLHIIRFADQNDIRPVFEYPFLNFIARFLHHDPPLRQPSKQERAFFQSR